MTDETEALTVFKTAKQMVVRPTKDPAQVANAVEAARAAGYNVLTPSTFLSELPKDHRLAVRVVHAPPNAFWWNGGGNAPRGTFLLELGRAAGVIWRADAIRRVDAMNDPYVCCFEAVCLVADPTSGKPQVYKGTYQLDLRENSATSEDVIDGAKTDEKGRKQLRQKRRFIVQLAETGAMLRALRKAIGVRGDYSKAEIAKPFVVVSLEYMPGSDAIAGEDDVHSRLAHEASLRMFYGPLMGLDPVAPPKPPERPALPAPKSADEVGDLPDCFNDPDSGEVVAAEFDSEPPAYTDEDIPFDAAPDF